MFCLASSILMPPADLTRLRIGSIRQAGHSTRAATRGAFIYAPEQAFSLLFKRRSRASGRSDAESGHLYSNLRL